MNPARMAKPAVSVTTPPADTAPEQTPGPVAADPVAAIPAPHVEPVAVAAPVEVKNGQLDPVAAAILQEIPDRPKKESAPDIEVAAASPVLDETPQAKPARRLLMVVGGASLAALAVVLGTRRKPGSAQAVPTPTVQQSAPVHSAPAVSGLVIK